MTPLDIAFGVFVGNAAAMGLAWAMFQFHKHDYRAPWAAYCGVLLLVGAALYVGLVDQDPVSFVDPEGARVSLTERQP
jgi:hypothetical protein